MKQKLARVKRFKKTITISSDQEKFVTCLEYSEFDKAKFMVTHMITDFWQQDLNIKYKENCWKIFQDSPITYIFTLRNFIFISLFSKISSQSLPSILCFYCPTSDFLTRSFHQNYPFGSENINFQACIPNTPDSEAHS